MRVVHFFRTMLIQLDILTGHFARDTFVAFLLYCLGDFWPPDVSYRH